MYLDLAGLARYKQDFDAWARGALLSKDAAAARVRTAKAGAVSFVPVQETPLDVSVDFLFSETPPASGDKSPANPSIITGVSSVKVTRCGKNLLPSTYIYSTMANRGITASYNADKSIHLKGTASSSSLPYMRFFTEEPGVVPSVLSSGTTVTISLSCPDSNVYGVLYDSDSPALWGDATIVYPGTPVTHTISANAKTVNFSLVVTRSAVVDCDVYCQIEFGQTATAWEAPADEDYTLPLGGTFYGGILDIASGVMTVTWEGVVFDGTEDWTLHPDSSGNFIAFVLQPFVPVTSSIYTGGISIIGNSVICSHFANRTSAQEPNSFYISGKNAARFVVKNNTDLYSDLQTFKTWLSQQYASGTPLSLVCALAVPYTVQLSPTEILSLTQPSDYDPRLNTVYSDAQAVQVGYLKHPSAASADLRNALVSLGGGV